MKESRSEGQKYSYIISAYGVQADRRIRDKKMLWIGGLSGINRSCWYSLVVLLESKCQKGCEPQAHQNGPYHVCTKRRAYIKQGGGILAEEEDGHIT